MSLTGILNSAPTVLPVCEPAVEQFKLMFPTGHTIITVPESPMFNAPEAAVVTVPMPGGH